ncbi:MAG: GNAT family N-acetyltransferase [Muribaculaceae bacterium]|nr:GNAT family N-acetyltransferase [Muribaculaceae bacterium]
MKYVIKKYSRDDKEEWDAFVETSRNGTFLFERDYMDYHSDRFADNSLMAYKGNRLVALLPANIDSERVMHSHQGLTYGGWILPLAHIDGGDILEIFQDAIEFMKMEGVRGLDYKPVPFIYAGRPSEEDIYALFRLGAQISEVNISSAINLRGPIIYNKLRKRSLKKALEKNITIEEILDCNEFMSLVSECLRERHHTVPVHTAGEIKYLQKCFPKNIRMFGVRICDKEDKERIERGDRVEEKEVRVGIEEAGCSHLHAGVMIYDTGRVAHAQYIASSVLGRELNLLTPLFDYLIKERYRDREYFDFGISNEDHGLYLNAGLLRQKFSYGATGVSYCRYYLNFIK